MKKKLTMRKRIHRAKLSLQYNFDNLMAKGIIVNILLIFLVTILTVLLLTGCSNLLILILNIDTESPRTLWTILLHIIDGGTVSNTQSKNVIYLSFMVFVAFLGLLINGALIGTINAAISKKINSLGLSNTKVYEQGHTVIIGFNSLLFTMIRELCAGMNPKKKHCIVVLSDLDLAYMNKQIKEQFPNTGKIKIICRSGKPNDDRYLRLCSVSRAKSVIINSENDFETIKQILTIRKYFEHSQEDNHELHISAIINDEQNTEIAKIAGGTIVNVMYFKDAISRIIAHACRYPGFSKVLKELFSFEENEIYFETYSKLYGKSIDEILYSFDDAVLIGIQQSNKKILLNPDFSHIYKQNEQLILIKKNAIPSKIITHKEIHVPEASNLNIKDSTPELRNVLILGENELLPEILKEFNKYINPYSTITVVSKANQKINTELPVLNNVKTYKNIEIDSYNLSTLKNIISTDFDTILLLSDLQGTEEDSDSEIITCLLCIQSIMKDLSCSFNIISQLRTGLNQKIADMGFSDFVVGSEITSMISTQISENKYLQNVLEELLNSSGSELFIRPISDYVVPETVCTLHGLQKLADSKKHIIIGCKHFDKNTNSYSIILNPNRNLNMSFDKNDSVIILAEEKII